MVAEFVTEDLGLRNETEPRQSAAVLEMMRLIKEESIKLSPEIIDRLKLLDSERCSRGECYDSGNISYEVEENGKKVLKKNETHLEHTMDLVRIVKEWFSGLKEFSGIYTPEMEKILVTAVLLHDIGKSGPSGIDPETQKGFAEVFSIFEKDSSAASELSGMKIGVAIEIHFLPEDWERIKSAMVKAGFDIENDIMGKVFASHLGNSLKVLSEQRDKNGVNISPEVMFLVGNHHRWTNNYGYEESGYLLESLPEDQDYRDSMERLATLLELADFFQALGVRGKQNPFLRTLSKIQEIYNNPNRKKPPEYVFQMIKDLEQHYFDTNPDIN